MTLAPTPQGQKRMSEMLREQIEQSKSVVGEKRVRFAEMRGAIRTMQRMPMDETASAIAQAFTFSLDESEIRMLEHITLLEMMKVMAEKIEEGFGFFESKTTKTNDILESMLGVDNQTPEKEIMERAKESGDIYNEIARRRRGEKR